MMCSSVCVLLAQVLSVGLVRAGALQSRLCILGALAWPTQEKHFRKELRAVTRLHT